MRSSLRSPSAAPSRGEMGRSARIRTAAEGLMPDETLALLDGLDFGATETLDLEHRLATRKLNRFHRWAYESR